MVIRRLGTGDERLLREVRLRALEDAPYAFSSSLAHESGLGPEFWEDRVAASERGVDSVVVGAVETGQTLGMAGGFLLREERGIAMVWGMWVAPSARRDGIGQKLLEAVADWARDAGADHLQLAVTDCEESRPASAFYRQLGFTQTGEQERLDWNPSLIARFLSRPL